MAHNIPITSFGVQEGETIEDVVPAKTLNSIWQRDKKNIKKRIKPGMNIIDIKSSFVEPKTENQRRLISLVRSMPQTIVYGPAGVGKTFLLASLAAEMLQQKKMGKIILTRPNVATGRSIGFFPGILIEKMEPWVAPFLSVLREKFGASAVENMQKNGKIEIIPLETIRGHSFENAYVVLDEAQNCTLDELKAFVTRVGKGSKLVIDGDTSQTDIKNKSGFNTIINMVNNYPDLSEQTGVIEFTVDDVVRSDICASWIRAFNKENL